eukprot:GEMP01015910.1.p1 GENE.GEMP01015910.1~~GEMP01015910.1.p1  ORF type:complete len:689 (+),score=130.35 GEMP01015910.1:117-2183(+)
MFAAKASGVSQKLAAGVSHPVPKGAKQTSKSLSDRQDGVNVTVVWDGKHMTPLALKPKKKEAKLDLLDESYREIMPDEYRRYSTSPTLLGAPKCQALTKQDLDVLVSITLTETTTDTTFHLPSLCVALDDTVTHSAVVHRNKLYDELVNSHVDSDQFAELRIQTANLPQKVKEVLAAPPDVEEIGVDASDWDIYDMANQEKILKHVEIQQDITAEAAEAVNGYLKKSGCFFAFVDEEKDVGEGWAFAKPDWKAPDELSHTVRVLERAVAQTQFHKEHMTYRNYPSLDDLEGPERTERKADDAPGEPDAAADMPYLEDLFCFKTAELTKNMATTSAQWNRSNQDLLAVSYGNTTKNGGSNGALLFWSLKNPTYPERVILTSSGVSAIAFSQLHPNMIAAGMMDGQVCIWDLRRPNDQPILESGGSVSAQSDKKHSDTVWEATWIAHEGREVLVTTGGDGRVLQWSLSKGLEQKLLMHLKRIPNPDLGSNCWYGHKDGIVFRHTAGLGIDFPKNDPSVYLAATEDGLVHRCSTSYYEQYLDTYYGHSGPVYKIRHSPFWSQAFLTCSADWTVRLWTVKGDTCHTCQAHDLCDGVNDVYWSPTNSTAFSAAMDDGRVELWDLAIKPHDPLVIHYPRQQTTPRTCVRFAHSPVLVSGDSEGGVDIMRIYNCPAGPASEEAQIAKLEAVLSKR